jgi:hypothetical protein
LLEISSMAKANVAAQLENLDQRLVRVEQILPTLATKQDLVATKDDLRREIHAAVGPLATNDELQRAIHAAIEPLATKDELRRETQAAIEPLASRAELREMRDELRRHMDVGFEALHSDIELLAEHLVRIATKVFNE